MLTDFLLTGWNIEKMNEVYPIKNFEKVILVDLTPSLCKIATERFHRRGWKNVEVLCQDAVTFRTSVEGRVSLVTMSYSCKYPSILLKFVLRWNRQLIPHI